MFYICETCSPNTKCVCSRNMCEKQTEIQPFASFSYTPACLCVCVHVGERESVCVCSPVVTVLKSKLTSPSPCSSICPSARPLGDYRERETGREGGKWRAGG